MLKERLIRLLYELMKNSKRSDRELAKTLGLSQPTISRMRKKLEEMGYIKEYTIVPDIEKLGFEIVAFTCMNIMWHAKNKRSPEKVKEEAHKWIEQNPNVIFAAPGSGAHGQNALMVSVHQNYTDFSNFIAKFRKKFVENVIDVESFLVSTKNVTPKSFTFKNLERISKP